MATPTSEQMKVALGRDLKEMRTPGLCKVVNDVPRKTFTARIDGAILEFAHKQPDAAFWNGIKYYGSGANSRVRVRRSPAKGEEAAVTSAVESATETA